MSSIERSRAIAATPEEIWGVLADFGALATWVPLVQHSCLLSEQTDGVGTVRRVQLGPQTLVERVSTWEQPHTVSYAIEGLPPMVGAASNTWRITPAGSGCDVTLTTEVETGRNPVKVLVAQKVLEKMSAASEFMLAGLAKATEQEDSRG